MASLSPSDEPLMLRAALDLVEALGVRIALAHWIEDGKCSCGDPDCGASSGKHPIERNWQELASADPDVIRRAFAKYPKANIGIATGRASGVVVLDIDEGGDETLDQYLHVQLPAAPTVVTTHGRHVWFRAPSVPLRNRAGVRGRGLGKGLDLRAEGGFAIVPPSMHLSGKPYDWQPSASYHAVALPDVPAWIVERAADQPPPTAAEHAPHGSDPPAAVGRSRAERWAQAAFERELDNVRSAAVGERNNVLNTATYNLAMIVGGGTLDGSEVKRALASAAQVAGLSELEAHKTIKSAFAAGLKREPRTGPTRELDGNTRANGPSDSDSNEQSARVVDLSLGGKRFTTGELFKPLEAQRWCIPDLQLGPGRPTLFVGFGASAKTFAAQSLALALAAGHTVWGRFECAPLVVLHADFEQGSYATRKRYQRLALGHGIDEGELEGRLGYIELPQTYLDQKGVREHYMRVCEGVDLLIVDSLRGAAPDTDENDSAFRKSVDVLTYVSAHQGTSVLMLHHASKPRAEKGNAAPDARTLARGTGAIFDAAGSVFNFVARPGEAARLVQQVKMPAEAEGAQLEAFELVLEDVTVDDVPNAGIRVLWRKPVIVDETAKANEAFERDAAQILKAVRLRSSGSTANAIVARAGMGRNRALDVLRALADEGRLELTKGQRGSRIYRIPADSMVTP